jgi:hypothetical protein
MRRFAPIVLAAGLALSLTVAAAPAHALIPADVSLTAGPISSVVSVSPDVYYDAASSTYYLYTTGSGRGGVPTPGSQSVGVYSSSDGQSWSDVTGASTPVGTYFDPSVVQAADGTYRMYYVYRPSMSSQPCSGKELRYATSTDLIRWTPVSTTLLADLGCGVPNVVRAGDEYRLYYVRGREVTSAAGYKSIEHGTFMATSPDGLTWTPTDRLISPQDFVDPSVVQLADGSWLMFTADFSSAQPPPPGFVQKLYVGTSDDGRTWDFDATAPLYVAGSNQGAFDPDAVVLPDGSVRAWWSQGTSADNAQVTAGRVTVTPSPDPDPVPVAPSKPTVKVGKAGIAVTWTYAAGAPAPDGFIVQVKSGSTWKEVARTERTSSSVTWAKVGAKKGMSFSVRVVAVIDDASATSSSTRATRPR